MKTISSTDWMIMGMIHVYKILAKTREQDSDADLNDVDYEYLVEIQKRNIENPSLLTSTFPFVFEKGENVSSHDNVHSGMMNVFHILGETKLSCNLNKMNTEYLITGLVEELEDKELYGHYNDLFVEQDDSTEHFK